MEDKKLISKELLIENSVHIGYPKRFWNPKVKPFVYRLNNNHHIFDVAKVYQALYFSYKTIEKIKKNNGIFLFVGTTYISKNAIEENAKRTNSFYISNRWLGGTLTNFKTIQNSVTRLKNLETLEKNNFFGYNKKEGLEMKRELDKLEKNIGGIKNMYKLPNALIVSSFNRDRTAINEAKKLGIPVFGLVNTNTNPTPFGKAYPIPSNDGKNSSVSLIITLLADALELDDSKKKIAFLSDDKIEVLGVTEKQFNKERKVEKVIEATSRTTQNKISRSSSKK